MKKFFKNKQAGGLWGVAFAKHPHNVEAIKKWLQGFLVFSVLMVGGAYYFVPDSMQKQEQLQSLELKKRQLFGKLSQIKSEKEKTGGVNAPPLEPDTAMFVARSLGGHIRQVQVAKGYMDISLPIQSLGVEFISPPSMAKNLEFYREAFSRSCGVRAIWPRFLLRIYISASSAERQ